ncbi:MAG: FtsX-like permease family protein, partial [Oscillospiraceae bacterium]|nr:FtsX-like permease family protein [Oscillospiraceae bacterium]
MNIFHKITRKYLAENRTRTIVTVIGIILSMALFTAVIEGAYSGVQYLLRNEIAVSGAYHGYYYNATEEQAAELARREDFAETATWQLAGWSRIDAGLDYPTYASVVSVDDKLPELVSVRLVNGRLPEGENEIIVPTRLNGLAGETFSVGNCVNLSVGRRVGADGSEIGLHGAYDVADYGVAEEIVDSEERQYTVVGIYETLDYAIMEDAGYLLLTKGPAEGTVDVFFTLKNIRSVYSDFARNQPLAVPYSLHSDLLMYHGISGNGNLMRVLIGMVVILVCLVSFGSISLIYNAFAISVGERTKQFGILRSVGATKKQIRKSVLYEALVLAGIGIPVGLLVGCAGIGITLRCLRDEFASMLGNVDSTVRIGLVLNPAMLVIAAVICLLAVLISAWIPAKRAAKVSAIEGIRQNGDLKIRGREVKTSRLTEKLFGFEGMMAAKNFKRNRKRYRSTVISLALSIVLFISAVSFCSYLTSAVLGVSSSTELTDIRYRITGEDCGDDPDDIMELLSSSNGITDSLYMEYGKTSFYTSLGNLDSSYIHNPYADFIPDVSSSASYIYGYFVFVSDDTFRALCRDNHLSEEDYFDVIRPVGVMYNNGVEKYREKDGEPWKWASYRALNESALPVELSVRSYREFDGYMLYGVKEEANGTVTCTYYPTEYLGALYNGYDGDFEPDESMAMIISENGACISSSFSVNAVIKENLFALSSDTPAVIFPYSMKTTVLEEDSQQLLSYGLCFDFRTDNHRQTYAEMEKL